MRHPRYGSSVEQPYYDQDERGVVDPRTGRFTPNIGSGGERMSAFDRTAMERGTNASPNSTVGQRWMGGNPQTTSAGTGIGNPPPTDLAAPRQVTQVRGFDPTSIGARPTGSEGASRWAKIQHDNRMLYAPSTYATSTPGATASNLNSEAIQSALDRASNNIVNPMGQNGSVQTPYGTAGVRFSKPGTPEPTASQTASATTMEHVPAPLENAGNYPAMIQHLTPLQEVAKAHPDLTVAGSPANIAFTTAHNAITSQGKTVDDPMQLANTTLAPLYASGQAKRGNPATPGMTTAQQHGLKPDVVPLWKNVWNYLTDPDRGNAILGSVSGNVQPRDPQQPAPVKNPEPSVWNGPRFGAMGY